MKIGIIGFLHESNTFSSQHTDLDSFRNDLLISGDVMRQMLEYSHHEIGGFFAGLTKQNVSIEPLFAARALPYGPIRRQAFDTIVSRIMDALRVAGKLDGLLVAPHGATVSEEHRDADGFWLNQVRSAVGKDVPIVGTLDAHANLSHLMVDSCDALLAYRTNPHLDQRKRGEEAANLLTASIRGEITPVMEARYPPLAISIDRQCTDDPPLRSLCCFADQQLQTKGVLSNSILLGFPYADVAEMGSSVIVVSNQDRELASKKADELAAKMWSMRDGFRGRFVSIQEAINSCRSTTVRVCLLDMGDNVGGGSSADGTCLLAALEKAGLGSCFVCLCDPRAVSACEAVGVGQSVQLKVGGKTDGLHGPSLELEVKVQSFHDGRFRERKPRHGGFTEFDQGRTAICCTASGITLMLTSRRMVPFSLQQLTGCGVDPRHFQILVAKGVNAPMAAYREVCQKFIHVNTPGSTCAEMVKLPFSNRRRPMFPFETEATFGYGI